MNVLLVELNESHDEGVLSWQRTLHELDVDTVFVACPERVADRLGIRGSDRWISTTRSSSLVDRLRSIMAVRRAVRTHAIDRVVLNTASGTYALLLSMAIPRWCRVVGVLHYMHTLGTSTTQRRIERNLDAYAVIAPHLLEMPHHKPTVPIHVVPYTAPLVAASRTPSTTVRTIAIPGTVDARRRAYQDLFMDSVMGKLPPSVTFVIVGNAGTEHDPDKRWFHTMLAPYKDRVRLFEHHLSHEEYHRAIADADAVLPLLHPGTEEYEDFLTDKCSGAFTLAWTYGKPLLLEDGFRRFAGLQRGARFYRTLELASVLTLYGTDEGQYAKLCAESADQNHHEHVRRNGTLAALS